MIASLTLFLGSTTIWISITVAAAVQNVRLGEWNSEVAIVGSVGVMVFSSVMWPGYWVYQSRNRIHRAVEVPTLSSIADVLEAQRSFWRALGILVLLAIAAIVVAATYPAWSTLFG
ncbi:MAG: hypothetical protein K2Y37_22970 [Pirellulales bacterium]|nr:hypothetical protein [Pirellulales bacterium]